MMTSAGWTRAAQVQLLCELKGFWANDLWDMHLSPVKGLSLHARQRRLYFKCKSSAINGELKYACWKKFSGGDWRSTQEIFRIHRLVHWLNDEPTLPSSLMERDFNVWRDLYRAYLTRLGTYKTGTTTRMDSEQHPRVTVRDSGFVSTLRQAYILLGRAYDLRPEREKDIWDLKRMGVSTNLSQSNVQLSFLVIKQEWLRRAVKSYLSYSLPLYSASTCRTRVQSITCFSNFLATERPRVTGRSITRRLLLEYLSYLQGRQSVAVRKNHVLNLRNFLEMSHRERWLPIGPERMIYDEEVPRPPKPQPRYLPATILDQLNEHLDDLKPSWKRKILILQECGMRISELLQLPIDCLTQDARGVHYLRYMQGKVKRENAIPISLEIARIIQEQQAELRSRGNLPYGCFRMREEV
jgi:integrase